MRKLKIMQLWRVAFLGLLAIVFTSTSYTAFANGSGTVRAQSYTDKQVMPAVACDNLTATKIADSTDNVTFAVQSVTAVAASADAPASCRVTVSATHPPSGDDIRIWVWLPSGGWNGRFQGTGGSGYSGGSQANLLQPLREGYATAATDTGHTVNNGSYVLSPDGSLNWQLVEDNILGVHEMTVAGKALTKAYYKKKPQYAYFTGCSTGARQGLAEAAQYPEDYDGITGGSPAINVTKTRIVQLWGQLVMKESGNFIPGCKFDAATAAAVQACDKLDRVEDGIINEPQKCTYDPHLLVGTATDCGLITQQDADTIAKIWQGARDTQGNFMWHGQPRGANLKVLNGTTSIGGELDGLPGSFAIDWIKYFLTQSPEWDWHTLTYARFEQLFLQSQHQYSVLSDSADLNEFRKAGGKLLLWQGQADQLLSPQGATAYYDDVVASTQGSLKKTQDFARLFMAPGVGHCGGGEGPQPTGQLQALKNWVEHDRAPEILVAKKIDSTGAIMQTRPLCAYPEVAAYRGHRMDTNKAASFTCKRP